MSVIRSKAGKEKYRKKTKWGFYIFLIILSLILIGLFIYLGSGRFDVSMPEIRGASVTKQAEVEKIVREEISKSLWGIIPRRTWLVYPEQIIYERLMKEVPSIESLVVDVGFRKLIIDIVERKASYIWCGDIITSNPSCNFVDYTGVIYGVASDKSSYLKLFGEIGKQIDVYTALDELIQTLKKQNMNPEHVVFVSPNEVKVMTDVEIEVLAILSNDMHKLSEIINTIIKEKASSTLSVIDVRIPQKIFLRYR